MDYKQKEILQKFSAQKVDLGFIDDVKKISSNLEKDWKDALRVAVDGSKELVNKLNSKIKPLNSKISSLEDGIDKSEKLLNDLGVGKNSDIVQAKKELKIAKGQLNELFRIARDLRNIY